jgi:hypothetical protein
MATSFATPNIGESLPAVFVTENTGGPFVPQVTFFLKFLQHAHILKFIFNVRITRNFNIVF